MVVYVDRLFLTTAISIYACMRFCEGWYGRRKGRRCDVLAAAVGGLIFVCGFCMLLCGGGLADTSSRVMLLVLYPVLHITYQCIRFCGVLKARTCLERLRFLGRNLLTFFLANVLLGCLVSGIQLLLPELTHTYAGGLLALVLSSLVLCILPKLRKRNAAGNRRTVRIVCDETVLEVQAFVDTGNLLRGPKKERVCVLREELYDQLRADSSDEFLVAYFSANGAVGTMPCIRVERLEIRTEPSDILYGVSVARGRGAFCKGYDMLLPEQWE